MKITVITLSDRAYNGEYSDLSGPEIEEVLISENENWQVNRVIIPDDKERLLSELMNNLKSDFIITTGGTGLSEGDITPETCKEFCDKDIPGISEMLRYESYKETPMAMISRGYSGLKGKTVIVNFPGSVKAVRLCTKVLIPILEHTVKMIVGGKH